MEALFAALEGTALAQTLRNSRWGYAALNTAHIFAIALLIGSVVPLNLRLLGVWRGISREAVVRVLAPVAASGLILALLTGPLLFSVRALEYKGGQRHRAWPGSVPSALPGQCALRSEVQPRSLHGVCRSVARWSFVFVGPGRSPGSQRRPRVT